VQDMVKTFGQDQRIIIWDLYNEPGHSGVGNRVVPLLESAFKWAREMKPVQPLTAGLWGNDFEGEKRCRILLEISDVISFHSYDEKDTVEAKIKRCTETGRPVFCTEWLRRQGENTPQSILPLFKEYKVGAYHFGLVEGRTQTYMHRWSSKKGDPKPEIWQHDLIRADGAPYNEAEYHYFRYLILSEKK
jgi:hypothetical protein